jgi:translation initiation factor 1A
VRYIANFNSQKRKNTMKKTSNNNNTENTETFERVRTPRKEDLEQLAVVIQLMGADQVKAVCEDGKERQIRIPGKLKKRVWLRENDIIIIKLWDFQPSKGDVVWRYLGNQVEWLKRKGYTKNLPI